MNNQILEQALHKAIKMEEKGYSFYKEASEKSTSNITKKTFGFLAESETFHIENIKKFYNILKEKGKLPKVNLEDPRQKRTEDSTIFSKSVSELKEKIKKDDDDKKACEFAMQFEKDGYNYYENMLKETQNKNLIALLNFLLEEEKRHYDLIMSMYTYITDSHNWFMYEEGSFPQG